MRVHTLLCFCHGRQKLCRDPVTNYYYVSGTEYMDFDVCVTTYSPIAIDHHGLCIAKIYYLILDGGYLPKMTTIRRAEIWVQKCNYEWPPYMVNDHGGDRVVTGYLHMSNSCDTLKNFRTGNSSRW